MTDTTWLAPQLIWAEDRESTRSGTPIRLVAGRCPGCSRSSFPDTGSCSWCGAATVVEAIRAAGRVQAATAVLHKTPGSDLEVPYLVALVRFESTGLDILGLVTGTADLDDIPAGTPITVVAGEPFADGRAHYAYQPERVG